MADDRKTHLDGLLLTVMNVLWTRSDASIHEIIQSSPDKQPGYSTVSSALHKLEQKGLVARYVVEGARGFRYRALMSAHDARVELLQDLLHRLFAGSPALLIRHLLETEGFTLQELKGIRDVLDRQERATSGPGASF